MRRFCKVIFFLAIFLCPSIASAAPTITVSGNSVTILGSPQTISLTCTLIDPNGTGLLKSGSNIITVFVTSSATPGNVATCGPIYSNDTIADGLGNLSTTYYSVKVFTVSNGVVASTPAKQNFYAFTGSGTVDLATATPLAPSFFSGPNGNVSMPGSLTVAGQIISTLATGTAPLVVASTTQVANLNASTLAGQSAPASAIVGISDSQTLTNKTFDISANTLKSSSNTAGHYPRNNGTQYVDNTIQAADVPVFAASGTNHAPGAVPDPGSSAGTTRFLREDSTWAAISGGTSTVFNTPSSATAASIGSTSMVTAPASDTNYHFSFEIAQTQATAGCTVAPNITVIVAYTESFRNVSVNLNTTIAPDSGVPSTTGSANFASSLTHYVYFGHADFRAKASTAISYSTNYFAGSGCGTGANYSIAPVLVQE